MNCLHCLYYFLKVEVTLTAYTAYTVAHVPTYIANRNINRLTLSRVAPSAVSKGWGGAMMAPPRFWGNVGGCGFKF